MRSLSSLGYISNLSEVINYTSRGYWKYNNDKTVNLIEVINILIKNIEYINFVYLVVRSEYDAACRIAKESMWIIW